MNQPKRKQKSPVAAGLICKPKNNEPRNISKLTPRMQRLLKALLKGPKSARELADAIPANNPPAYVQVLRKCHGFTVPLERVEFSTMDGRPSWYGSYHLTPDDREKAAELLRG